MAGRGFGKLRIAVAGGLAVSGVAGVGPAARATATNLPQQFNATGSHWQMSNSNKLIDNAFAAQSGYGMPSAFLTGTDSHTTLSCTPTNGTVCHLTTVGSPTSLYASLNAATSSHGAFLLQVGSRVFSAPSGSIDVNGNVFTAKENLAGLKVEYRTVFLGNKTAAVLYSFKNPGRTTKVTKIKVGTNFEAPTINDSSTLPANQLFNDDSWFVVSPGDPVTAPVLTFARGDCGPGSRGCVVGHPLKAPSSPSFQSWIEFFKLTVAPHRTKRLLFYVRMSEDTELNPHDFDNRASLVTAGLFPWTDAEKKQIVNWKK